VPLTNLHGLPDALVRAVERDPYDNGGADISVTKLIDAPQRRVLLAQHGDQIESDVTDMLWALMGQAVHTLLERAAIPGALVEHRFFAECEGWKISGQADWLHPQAKTLVDYKVTNVYKANGDKQWEKQLNVLRWLALQNNVEVERAYICAIFRDWTAASARRGGDYPVAKAKMIPVRLWPISEARDYVTTQVRAHQQAQIGERVLCTDEERWATPAKWALMQVGRKRALKLFDQDPGKSLGRLPEDQYIERRAGMFGRCQHYCEVAPWCTQWAETHHDSESHDTAETE
jgi:hypothetical protein